MADFWPDGVPQRLLGNFPTPQDDLRFHHVGIVSKTLVAATALFSQLGFDIIGQEVVDSNLGVKLFFMRLGTFVVEIIEPIGEQSPARSWLKSGSPIYHVGFETTNLMRKTGDMVAQGFKLVYGPRPAEAFGGRKVVFLINKDRLLLEIIEAAS